METTAIPRRLHIYAFRHGETNWDASKIQGRAIELPLNGLGERQAVALGKRLLRRGVKFDHFFSSPALRARRSAEIVCEITGFSGTITYKEGLLEQSQGDWEGKDRKSIPAAILAERDRRPALFRAPGGGESPIDVEKRTMRVYNGVLVPKLNCEQTLVEVGVSSHRWAMTFNFRGLMGSQINTYNMRIVNCSLNEFEYLASGPHKGWNPIRLNDVGHLEPPEGPGYAIEE